MSDLAIVTVAATASILAVIAPASWGRMDKADINRDIMRERHRSY